MTRSFLLIVLASILFLSHAGQIYSHDVLISPNNVGAYSNITLAFTPETSLSPTDFLRVIFPFQIASITSAYWDTYVNCSISNPSRLASIIESSLPDDTNTYFIQFYNDQTTAALFSLIGNVTYYITITGSPQAAGPLVLSLPVEMYTVSNNIGNWIVYDSNPVFGLVTLADAYSNGMATSIVPVADDSSVKNLNVSYVANIDFTPQNTILNKASVDIEIVNPAFTIQNCQSIQSPPEDILMLTATYEQISSNIIRALISETLLAKDGAKYRFQCTITNPAQPGLSAVTITNRMGYTDTIVESGTSALGLEAALTSSVSTVDWDEAFHSVELGWGYQASSALAVSVFSLYKDASPAEVWYQSMKTIFKPKGNVATISKLQLLVATVNDPSFQILTSTIYHNLPDYSNTETVSCGIITQGYLTCSNVGPLSAEPYFISFRFALLSTTVAGSAPNFGQVLVQTQLSSPVILMALSQTTILNTAINSNVPLFTNATSQGVIAYATTTAGNLTRDYITANEAITLNFRFKYFTNRIIPVVLGDINMGIEFYTSYTLPTSGSNTTCQVGNLIENVNIQTSNCAVATDAVNKFTKLSFRVARFLNNSLNATVGSLFPATAADGRISFTNVQFNEVSSLTYVNEGVYDYYVRWVSGYNAANPNIITAGNSTGFFFNSLVYSLGGLSNVQVATSFFLTGSAAGAIGNNATVFPTLIRLTGSLSAAEQNSTDKLLLFFNDLAPLTMDNPCFGTAGIQCSYIDDGLENTQTNNLTDYSGSKRIEVDLNSTTQFNLYIPVQTLPNQNSIGFFLVGVSSSSNVNSTNQGIFNTSFVKRVPATTHTAPTFTTTSLPIAPASSTTPSILIPNGALMGDTIVSKISNIQAGYFAGTANSGSAVGAAYGYCANYNFAEKSGFAFSPYYATGSATPQELCVTMQYTSPANLPVTCYVCPVDSPMAAGSITITNFQLPTLAGADFADLTYVVGSANGALIAAAKDNQQNKMKPFTLLSHSMSFSTGTLRQGSFNTIANITFRPTFELPQSIQIVLTPSAPSSSLLMKPLAIYGCQAGPIDTTSCAVSGNASSIVITVSAEDSTWPVDVYNVLFMVDANASITNDTTVSYQTSIYVNGVQPFGALHDTSAAVSYPVQVASLGNVSITNVSYSFPSQGALSTVSISFNIPNNTAIYSEQLISFNLGSLVTNNTEATPLCVVKNSIDGSYSSLFYACNVTDLTNLTLNVKDSAAGNFTVDISYLYIAAPVVNATGVTLSLISVDGITLISTSQYLVPPTTVGTAMTAQKAVITRYYSNPGSVAELSIELTPSINPINMTTQVFVQFPSYYADKLGYKNIWCTANDEPIQCSIVRTRVLMVTYFPETIALGQTVDIRVYGIITPVVTVPAGQIFVAMNNGYNMTQVVEYATITDQASEVFIADPLVVDFQLSTDVIREDADYTFSFITNSSSMSRNSRIIIDFPDQFGNSLRGQEGPAAFISKTGDSIPNQVQTIAFGSRMKIILPLDLDPMTSYTVVIKALENPDNAICSMDMPMISVTDASEAIAYSRTVPMSLNGAAINYVADPTLKELNWVDVNGNPITSLAFTVGTFSPQIFIIPPPGEYFNSDVSFTISDNELTVDPLILTAVRGSASLSFRIGASISIVPRTILVKFYKYESSITDVYSELPRLEIVLTNIPSIIPTQPIQIMRGGTSLPYIWDLNQLNFVPETSLTITATVNNTATSTLSIVGNPSYTFTSDSYSGGFQLSVGANANVNDANSFILSLSGTDAVSYQFQNALVPVTVIDPIYNAPVVNSISIPNNFAPITQQITINVDQLSSVYYDIAYPGMLSGSDCKQIITNFNQNRQFDPLSDSQEQYGVFYVYNPNQDTQCTINNLVSNQAYAYKICVVNQLGFSTLISGTFTTQNNQAALSQVTLTFSQAINRDQLISTICVFARELQLPDLNIVAMDGTTCAANSPLQDFSMFDYKVIILYIYGDRRSNLTSTTGSVLAQYVSDINTNTPSAFQWDFNQALSGAGVLSTFTGISLKAPPSFTSPVLGDVSKATVKSGDTVIGLYGLTLTSGNGIFYGIADVNKTSVGAPTRPAIRIMNNAAGEDVSGSAVMTLGKPVTLYLTQLEPSTVYDIYFYATSTDTTQYAATTAIQHIQYKTKQLGVGLSASRMGTNLIVILAVLLSYMML